MRDIRTSLPNKIRDLRIKAGLTQEELALRANTSQSNISRAESGQYGRFTVSTLLKIANGLDMDFVGDFVCKANSEGQL